MDEIRFVMKKERNNTKIPLLHDSLFERFSTDSEARAGNLNEP